MQSTADNDENVDNETTQDALDCLHTPVILRVIFQRIPSPQLLKLSLVNKLWNHEARIVMRDRGNVTALMNSGSPCQDLLAFSSILDQMNVVMFSGINISLGMGCHPGCVSSSPTSINASSYDAIFNQLQWKNLAISFPIIWSMCGHCPAFIIVKTILDGFGRVLEKLSLAVLSYGAELIQLLRKDCIFSRLKLLTLKDQQGTTSAEYSSFIKALVSRAPNLKMLITQGPVDLRENLLEGSRAVLLTNHQVSPSADEISDRLVAALRMSKMKLRQIRQGLIPQRINMTIKIFVKLSSFSLTSMEIDAMFLAPLMCYGISLVNVRELAMHFSSVEPYPPSTLRGLKEFDFTRLLPRLTKVHGYVNVEADVLLQDQITGMLSCLNSDWNEPKPDRAGKIKSLLLEFPSSLEFCRADFLPEMLPNVEALSVAAHGGEIIPSLVWDQRWVELKGLAVLKIGSSSAGNATLDSAFCGIFPEEVAQLREKDDEFLKTVHIVPVMPSFVCLKGLRTLNFVGDRGCFFRPDPTGNLQNDPSYMFSRVTGLIAFKRCPALSVALMTGDSEVLEALDHMKPYAKVAIASNLVGYT